MSDIDWENGVIEKPKTPGEIDWESGDIKEPAKDKGIGGHLKDTGISLAQGIIGVPEALVGLADIPTGGRVGKFLENEDGMLGFRPKQAREYLGEFKTEKSKEQAQQFADADGIIDKAGVAISNPSMIANTLVESAPSIGLGGVLGRGVIAGAGAANAARAGAALSAADKAEKARKLGAIGGAVGEGLTMAGQQASEIRSETDDGLLTGTQAAYSAATGALGTLFGWGGSRLAQRLGIGDIDTLVTQGAKRADIDRAVAQEIASTPAKSLPRNVIEGAITEGFLEELPQSVSEQILQNLALGRDWSEGIEDAAVMGTLAGMAMGAGAGGYSNLTRTQGGQGDQQGGPAAETPPAASAANRFDQGYVPEASINVGQLEREGVTPPPVLDDDAISAWLPTANEAASRPSEQMGLNPNAGPMSAAAAVAVDTGASQQVAAEQAAQVGQDQQVEAQPMQAAAEAAQQEQAAPQQQAAPAADEVATPARKLTAEAEAVIQAVETGGVPVIVTNNLRRVAEENGIEVTKGKKPNEIISELKAVRDGAESAPATDERLQTVDPETGEITGGLSDSDKLWEQTYQERLDYISKQAKVNGWSNQLVDERNSVQSKLDELRAKVAGQQQKNTDQDAPAESAVKAEKTAPASADIKAIVAKQIPQMTDGELQQAADHYGPWHKRTAKINKEIAKRGIATPTQEAKADGQATIETQQAGAQRAPETAAAGTKPEQQVDRPEFTTVTDRWGGSQTVKTADLESGKGNLKTYTKAGAEKPGKSILRDNLDLDGEAKKQREADNATNPLMAVVTKADGTPFTNKIAAGRAMNQQGLADTHELVKVDGGYVIKRKANKQQPAQSVATPTYEQAKAAAEEARQRSKAASDAMGQFPKGNMGLTPEATRATPEWQAAKAESDAAFQQERDANRYLVENFPEEYKADRDAEKAEKLAKLQQQAAGTAAQTDSADNDAATSPNSERPEPTEAQKEAGIRWDSQTGKWTTKKGDLNVAGKKRAEGGLDQMPEDYRADFEQVRSAVQQGDSPAPTMQEVKREQAETEAETAAQAGATKKDLQKGNDALIAEVGKLANMEKRAVADYMKKHGVEALEAVRDSGLSQRQMFSLLADELRPHPEFLELYKSDNNIGIYYRAKAEHIKGLSTDAYLALIDDTREAHEFTPAMSYAVLRHSDQEAEIEYIAKLGRMANRFRIGSQEHSGKLNKMARPYVDMVRQEKNQQQAAPEPKPVTVTRTEGVTTMVIDPAAGAKKNAEPVKAQAEPVKENAVPAKEKAETDSTAQAEKDLVEVLAGLSNAEMSALIDEIENEDSAVADTAKPVTKRKRKTSPKSGAPKTRQQISEAEATDIADEADVERTAGEIIKSFGYNSSKAGAEGVQALLKMFGGNGRLNSGLSFDEETYAAAKPHFQAMLKDAQAAGKDIKDFLRLVVRTFGSGIKPYIIRFANDQRDVVAARKTGGTNEQLADGDADQGGAAEVRGRGGLAQQGTAQTDTGNVAQGQPADGGQVGEAEDNGRPGVRLPRADVAGDRGQPQERDAADGRTGAGRAGSPDARAGAGRADGGQGAASPVTSPAAIAAQATDLHIDNPLEIVGGTPVQRFNRNREALELLQDLEVEGRQATPEEQRVLAAYIGWGSFGQELFQGSWDHPKYRDEGVWKERGQWLRDTLGESAWKSAQRSITNAHYTDPPTVMAMWDMVRLMGFEGGRVLEPSMGAGNFFSMMPADVKARSQLTGIELDETTGAIAKQLFPRSNIRVMGYQDSKTPDNFYDVVIGNWPFENTPVADRRYNKLNPMLHDYFFLKTMDQVRPGGIVIGITSSGSMDKQNTAIRRELAKQAELVTSIRLPSGAFEQYAGTKVVTDIVVLRKRPEKLAIVPDDASWVNTAQYKTPSGEEIRVNQFYIDNPGNVIGTLDYGHGTTQFGAGMIVHRPDNMEQRLREAVNLVPEGALQPANTTEHLSYYANESGERHGALAMQDGKLMLARGDQMVLAADLVKYAVKSQKETANREAQIGAAIELRRKHSALVDAERAGRDAEAERKALRDAYQGFTKEHGSLRDSFALRYMERVNDPFYFELAALEADDGKPAAIMERSTTRGKRSIENPSVRDAYVLARNQSINPALKDVAELAGKTEAEVKAELMESGAVFEAPNGDIVPSDIYLSGNVRQKLREAKAALDDGNEAMAHNIEELQKVVPAEVPYFNIETKLGATWVPGEAYQGYIASMLGRSSNEGIDIAFRSGRWRVKLDKSLNRVAEASANYGTPHYSFSRLAQAALSNQVVRITKKDSEGGEYVDFEATAETNGKIAKIREDFATWLWSDPERRVDLEREYNESRNAWATPKYDGSFLTFEGMALQLGDGEFNLRKHQADAIWRAIVNRRSLNAHEVGTGKTFTMGGIAIESRRYGIAKKPVLLAHNANSATVAAEIRMMYPSARVLYVDNLEPKDRDLKLRQIANDDWDVVVMPHSLIDRLALTEETLMRMAEDDIANLEAEFREAAAEDGESVEKIDLDDDESIKKIRSTTAKELAKARKRIIETIKKQGQQASRENAVTFEDLGIDMILVDEVHEFKKPPIVTRMKMKGLNTDVSQRSIALQFLTRYVRQMNNGGNVHTFTGTPITNTITEIYHQMRYVMESEMEQANVSDWDGWFGSFATEVQDVELTGAGDYEMVTRLAGFVNVPELRQMVGQYMDTVFAEDMPEMQPRKTKSGKALTDDLTEAERMELLNGRTEGAKDRPYKKVINDTADMLDEQMRVFMEVQGLAQEWRDATGKQRKEWMMSGAQQSPIVYERIANTASTDVRLLDEKYVGMEGKTEDDPNSKASRAVRNVVEIYNSDPNANQVIFTDTGYYKTTKRSGGRAADGSKLPSVSVKVFSPVHDMVERLVQSGIPREQIAVVNGDTSKERRREIAEAMNASKIRVVIGSTQTLGVGVNMQRNLRAMHHMDAPYMPGELEQRNGRGQRQGNQWNTVLEYRYMTDRLDGKRWQILAVKQRFINAFMKANSDARVIEGEAAADEQSDILESFSEAAGDPRILQREKLQKKLDSLKQKERLYTRGIADIRSQIRTSNRSIESAEKQLAERDADAVLAILQGQREDYDFTIGDTKYNKRADAVKALDEYLSKNIRVGNPAVVVGHYAGIPLRAAWQSFAEHPEVMLSVAGFDFQGKGINGLEAVMRNAPEQVARLERQAETGRETVANMERALEQPFGQAEELKRAGKQLDDLEKDLAANPVPPPAWLRQGAPMDSEVRHNKQPFVVTGHRYTADGWFVLAEDAKGQVVIPYLEATDSAGMQLYEAREFTAPTVVEAGAKQGEAAADDNVKFSFAGRKSGTAMHKKLGEAIRQTAMGTNPERVRQNTGWHRGVDGKWRYEISDNEATLAVSGKDAGELIDMATISAMAKGRNRATAADLMKHDKLFDAYPALKNVYVMRMENPRKGAVASVRVARLKKGTRFLISINPSVRADYVLSAMLHELQHGIQAIEGFALGGSANTASQLANLSISKIAAVNTYLRLAGEVEARNTQARMRMDDAFRQMFPPSETADVSDADAIVTFNRKKVIDFTTAESITEQDLKSVFAARFPKLTKALDQMLAKGAKRESGGLVILDDADPLRIAGEFSRITGRNLNESIRMFYNAHDAQGFFDPRSGITFLVGPSVTEANAAAVVLHEAIHGQQNKRLDQAAVQMLVNRKQEGNKDTRDFLDRVVRRMARAEGGVTEQEAAAYIVELAIAEGRDTGGHQAIDGKLMTWIESTLGKGIASLVRDFVRAYRQFALRHGLKLNVTVDDMIDYAKASMRQSARDGAQADAGQVAHSRASGQLGDTIKVDGIDRPTKNSSGQLIHPTEEGVRNFWRWFGDSKAVDAQGKPLVVYHGSPDVRGIIDGGFAPAPRRGSVFFFSDSAAVADTYADDRRAFDYQNAEPHVLPVYLSMQNPYVVDAKGARWRETERHIKEARDGGHDGIIIRNSRDEYNNQRDGGQLSTVYAVFEPTKVKSAATGNLRSRIDGLDLGDISNRGTFDPTNPDIRFSRSGFKQFAAKTTDELNKTFSAPGKLSKWHTTVGTMNNLAERSPHFKPVFQAAQGFIDDVAYYAADAAELAGKLLPKLETWRDIAKKPISAKDNQAIEKPINEGTLVWARDANGKPVRVESLMERAQGMSAEDKARELMDRGMLEPGMNAAWKGQGKGRYAKLIDSRYESKMLKAGIVWTPAELKSQFGLTGEAQADGSWSGQIGLYQEFRAAVDRSLDTMGRADMLRFGGKDLKPLREQVMDAPDIQAASRIIVNELKEMAADNPDRETQLMQIAHGIVERAEKVAELQKEGYAPLSRFGKYTVDVVVDGERQYFSLFETAREANAMAEQMRAEFGAGNVSQGTLSDESYKLFAGITPESLELFGNMLGLDSDGDSAQDQAFQEYLRLTKTNRSAMRRLIHRKGIAGFSTDMGRVLANFVYSNARQTAAGLNMGDLGDAITAIPKAQGELTDVAVRLAEYIKNPQEEAQAVRGLLFAQYLGGSVASAFVNITQPFAVTFPWLSQYGGAKKAAAELAKAAKDMSTKGKKYEADLAAALKAAEDDGTVSPQEVHQLMAQARGSGSLAAGDGTRLGDARAAANNSVARLSLAWGKMFGAAEQVNRRVTFIAAYRVARDQGMENPAEFARVAVRETQFIYSKANKMQWGRGAVGGTLMTFKTYSIAYIELMHRLWNQGEKGSPERKEGRKAAMLMVATLLLMGGAGGLPFAEDLEDVIDGAAQLMGYNFSAKKAKEQFLIDVFGDSIAEFIDKGVSGLPGSPMDVSGRLGLGNLIPGTGLFTERASHSRDLLEIAGPAGDFASRILTGTKKALGGDVVGGVTEVMPTAVRNAMKGADMAVTGMYRDTKGYKVLETTHLEAALKAMGFQPSGVSKVQEANWLNQREKNFYNMKAQEIRAQWAAGIFEKNPTKVQAARDAVASWNKKNPDQPIVIRIPDVMRRVREMAKSKDQRIADTAPKAMRARMREESARLQAELQ